MAGLDFLRGLFGSSAREATTPPEPPPERPKLTWRDRAMIFAAGLGGDVGDAMKMRQSIEGRAARSAFMNKDVLPLIEGGYEDAPPPPSVAPAPLPSDAPGLDTPNLGLPQAEPEKQPYVYEPPKRGAPAGIEDPRWAKVLLAGKEHGVDLAPVMDWLKANQPDVRFDNGIGFNSRDRSEIGKFHPKLSEGQEPLFNARGEIVSIRNMDGSVKSAAEMAGAVANAQERAKAGYAFEDIPLKGGGVRRMPRLRALQDAGADPSFGVSQTPAEAAGAKVAAESEAKRVDDLKTAVANDEKIIPMLGQMEGILNSGDLITGLGADVRLGADRALALAGNEDAKRRVSATETFQNLTSRQVLPLVKQLGSGNGITDADRKFTQAIVAGDISLNEDTIRRVIEIGRRQAEFNASQLARYSRQTNDGGGEGPGAAPRITPEQARAELARRRAARGAQ